MGVVLLTSPVSVDTVVASQVVDSVQATFVLVKPLQPHFVPQNCEELGQIVAVVVIVEYLLLRVLTLLHVDHANLQLGLDEHLVELQEFLAGVRKLAKCQRRVQIDFSSQRTNNFLSVIPSKQEHRQLYIL